MASVSTTAPSKSTLSTETDVNNSTTRNTTTTSTARKRTVFEAISTLKDVVAESSMEDASKSSLGHGHGMAQHYVYSFDDDMLQRMRFEIENTTRRLEVEQRRLFALDEGIKRAHTELRKKYVRKNQASVQERRRRTRKLSGASRRRSLEGWLADAVAKLNYVTDANASYKMAINRLRMERKHLDEVGDNLRLCIRQNASMLSKYVTTAKGIKDEVEQKKEKMTREKRNLKGERALWRKEVTRLNASLLSVRQARKREENERVTRVNLFRNASSEKKYLIADEEERFSEQTMYRQILKCAFLNCIQRKHIKQHQKNIEVFEQAFATIKSSTGISCIEQIVRIFTKLEERHFSLLTYVNQLNQEMESVEVANRNFHVERKHMEAENDRGSVQRKLALMKVQETLERTLRETAAQTVEQHECDEILATSVRAIEYMYELMKDLGEEPQPPVQDDHPSDQEPAAVEAQKVTAETMLDYISGIVSFYESIFTTAAPAHGYDDESAAGVLKSGDTPKKDKKGPCGGDKQAPGVAVRLADLPSCNLQDSDDDEDERTGGGSAEQHIMPLTRAELRARAEKQNERMRRKREK